MESEETQIEETSPPTSEPSLEVTPAPPAQSWFGSAPPPQVVSPPSVPMDESSESSSETTQEPSASANVTSSSPPPDSPEPGVGTGGTGDHPAPAVMTGPDGELHVAGEPPAGNIAGTSSPFGDTSDLQSGDLSPEAEAARDAAPSEHEQIDTDRPDIGTPE